jgi:hypothetical protein
VFLAEAAPLRTLTADVQARTLHAFPIKAAQGDLRRGYGEHPYLTWFRVHPTVSIAWWRKQAGQPVRITIKDENGSVWQEMEATGQAGFMAVEYDLSADPAKADAAEAVARAKALEKKKAAKSGDDKDKAAEDEEEEEGEDEATARPAATGAPVVLDDDLHAALADPLRATRERFLPPGRYTVEIASGGETAKTRLTVKPPREQERVGGGE